MCGFAGFLSLDGQRMDEAERRAVLARMGRLLAHRGPDDETFYDDGVLSLVFRRLSIVDVAGGEQPIFNEDGSKFIVVNGEIYNHAELRRTLAPRHQYATHSDSETPLHLYEERGPAALDALRGMFALAIWDRRERRLFLARDRFGIKPLYVCRLPHGLLFGSELKALLVHPECPRDLDWSALAELGPQQIAGIPTYVRGVEHLPAGHCLIAGDGRVETRCWWRVDEHLASAPFGDDAARYRDEFARLIEEATLEHLLGEVPIGLHLSGGLDSSLMAAIVASERRDLHCFSAVEYATWRSGDVAAAQHVTETLGLPWRPVLFDRSNLLDEMDFGLERLEQSVHMMDSPRFDLEWIFKEELHRYARRECAGLKVVLLGQGIDEFAGGYSRRINVDHAHWAAYLRDEVEPELRYWGGVHTGIPERLRDCAKDTDARGAWAPYHRKMRAFAHQLEHFNLWHEDRSSASQSLEARVPYLDHRIVELLASVPAELHETLFWDKAIVRDAMRRRMPEYDLARPKVPFFLAGDTRSIDILVHEMLQRCVPAFLEKYLGDPDLPFDRAAVQHFASRVLGYQKNFHAEGWRLMELLAIAIFSRQCRQPDADDFSAQRSRAAGAPSLDLREWDTLDERFSDSPRALPQTWRATDRVRIPEGTRVMAALGDEHCFELTDANGSYATISVPAGMPWVPRLLQHLNNPEAADFTVADWADEFDLDPATLCEALEALQRAGFVVRR